jgi:hypothetical protein
MHGITNIKFSLWINLWCTDQQTSFFVNYSVMHGLPLPSLCVDSTHCRVFSLASWTRGESILLSEQMRALPLLSLFYNRESLTLNILKISSPPRRSPSWSRLLAQCPGEDHIPKATRKLMDCLTIKIYTSHKPKSHCHITPAELTGSSFTYTQ